MSSNEARRPARAAAVDFPPKFSQNNAYSAFNIPFILFILECYRGQNESD